MAAKLSKRARELIGHRAHRNPTTCGEGLSSIGRLEVRENGLYNTAGLEGLTEVGDLTVEQNGALISLAGLGNLRRAGSVSISENPRLCARLGLLPRLAVVDQKLSVTRNWGLSASEVRDLHTRTGRGDRVAGL